VSITEDAERRPSWAPPLVLEEELANICYELGYLTDDNKWIARFWATFATPKRSGRWLREHVSNLPLTCLSCRGFSIPVDADGCKDAPVCDDEMPDYLSHLVGRTVTAAEWQAAQNDKT